MARSFKLPDLGEGLHEAEIRAVLVSLGQKVKEGDPILEVETDKVAVEIPSPFSGVVKEILVKQGDTVKVGDVLMTFSGEGEGVPLEDGKPMEAQAEPFERDTSEHAPNVQKRPVPASPATRRLARELGVDLHRVNPTGPAGLVTADDVRAFAEAATADEKTIEPIQAEPAIVNPTPISAPPLPDFSRWGEVEREPLRSIRKSTARQMTLAWSQIPHVSNQDVVDITKLESLRKKHKAEIKAEGGNLTLTVFALKAVASALKAYPRFNATLDTNAEEIIIKHYFHIGVAVNMDEGLIVPVVRDVDRKSILELSIEMDEIVRKTRERKVSLEEMQGGTFTITNVGPLGGGHFAPIINHPQVAILGMGSARLQAVVRKIGENGHEIVPRLMMPIVLSIDHRVLDGADGIKFMRSIIESLEDPEHLMMTMI